MCSRIVGYGAPLPMDGKSDLAFNIEIVCARCETRYARCSDCGGKLVPRSRASPTRCAESLTLPSFAGLKVAVAQGKITIPR